MTTVIVSPAADRDIDAILEAIRMHSGSAGAAAFDASLDATIFDCAAFQESARRARCSEKTFA